MSASLYNCFKISTTRSFLPSSELKRRSVSQASRCFSTRLNAAPLFDRRNQGVPKAWLRSIVDSGSASHGVSHKRFISLHEYQSKELLKTYGLNVQRGGVAKTAEEADQIAQDLLSNGATELVIKAQVLAGGRGKGTLSSGLKGGIHLCKTAEDVGSKAKQMLGHYLETKQTAGNAEKVNAVLVLEAVDIEKELYLAVLLDPTAGGPVFVASKTGGVNIEEIAEKDPNAVKKVAVPHTKCLSRDDCLSIVAALGLNTVDVSYPLNVADQIGRLYDMMIGTDATMVEINPLAVTKKCTDHLICIDAKLTLDDNASYRQQRLVSQEDTSRVDPKELEARKHGLSYIALDGSIACVVNGAGLAMATMDLVHLHGGKPANFLDVGGGATPEQVTSAFQIIQSDGHAKAIFVNIFGGIMRCDIIAEGLVKAAQKTNLQLPLIVRLVGNRVDEGKRILKEAKIRCVVLDDLEQAAEEACKASMKA